MELGVALLWARDYVAASDHFEHAIVSHPLTLEILHAMAGTARWCLTERERAVEHWRYGAKAAFADSAGGAQSALLIWFASVVDPALLAQNEVAAVVEKKIQHPRSKNWPGPLLRFVRGEMTEASLKEFCAGRDDIDTTIREFVAQFYVAARRRREDRLADYVHLMRTLADLSGPEWTDDTLFLRAMWSVEFFLARHESQLSEAAAT